MTKEKLKEIRDKIGWLLLPATLLVLLNFFYVTVVVSGSMEPTIMTNDFTLGRFISPEQIEYDDIILFYRDNSDKPRARNAFATMYNVKFRGETVFCKRVIGLPGDTIEVKDGYVWRNGEKLDPDYLTGPTNGQYGPYTVPKGCMFCMGDNRDQSSDSRLYGAFPMENVILKVILH